MEQIKKALPLIGRILISAIFIISAYNKAMSFEMVTGMLEAMKIPAANILLFIAIALEGIGALMVLLGFKTRIGILIIIAFLIPTTIMMHWDLNNQDQILQVLKNSSILGGLLFVLVHGGGAYAIDKEN